MRRILVIGILFLFVTACKTSPQPMDGKACRYFKEKISLVEGFYNESDGYSNELLSASNFLEEITTIKADVLYHYSGAEPKTNSDLNQWKNWYNNNKHRLYWDKTEQTVKVKKSSYIFAMD